jgi:hypothetical protein
MSETMHFGSHEIYVVTRVFRLHGLCGFQMAEEYSEQRLYLIFSLL